MVNPARSISLAGEEPVPELFIVNRWTSFLVANNIRNAPFLVFRFPFSVFRFPSTGSTKDDTVGWKK